MPALFVRQWARVVLVGMLISSVGCGRATHLSYALQARPEQVFHKAPTAVPVDTAGAWSKAQRVVLDLSPKCNAPAAVLRSRCEHVEAALSEAIRRTGREVIVSKQSRQAALDLARAQQAAVVLTVELPAYTWTAGNQPSFYLTNAPEKGLAGADLRCTAEVRSYLKAQATQLKAGLNAQIESTDARVGRWGYHDALEGQVEIEGGEIEARFEGREQDTSGSSDDTVVYHHHHDHSCHHHDGHRRERDHDDDGAAVIAAVVLTVLVVGIVILAASAAQSDDARCTVLRVPEPSMADKQRLAERLDRLLSERLVSALQTSGAQAPLGKTE